MGWPMATKTKRHKPLSWLILMPEWMRHLVKYICTIQTENEKNVFCNINPPKNYTQKKKKKINIRIMYCYTWNSIYGYNNERKRDDAKE